MIITEKLNAKNKNIYDEKLRAVFYGAEFFVIRFIKSEYVIKNGRKKIFLKSGFGIKRQRAAFYDKNIRDKRYKMYFACINKKKACAFIFTILAGAIAVLALTFTGASAVFYGGTLKKLPVYYVKTEEKKIAISFDCAWGVDYTDKLLAIMKAENVRCTFFAVEFWAEKYPDYLKKISDAGHETGTHSATHPYMSKLDEAAIKKELATSCEAIERVTGKKVELFRPPYGDYDDLLIETASGAGLYTIQWSVDSLDWKNLSATQITERVLKRIDNGSIILCHNQGLHTAEALPDIIKGAKAKGFEFVPIGELIYRENYRMAPDGAQIKNS